MDKVIFYTDGSCLRNPGPGGWAVIARYGNHEKIISGGEKHTTNNKMELQAVIEALKMLKRPVDNVEIYSDSNYIVRGINEWLDGWSKRNYKNVKNPEQWREIEHLIKEKTKNIKAIWVKAHNGHPENEKVDKLAKQEAVKYI